MHTRSSRRLAIAIATAASVTFAGCGGGVTGKYLKGHSKEDAFVSAAAAGDLDAVKAFLDGGANVNTRNGLGSTPLMDAAGGAHVEIVQRCSRRAPTSTRRTRTAGRRSTRR